MYPPARIVDADTARALFAELASESIEVADVAYLDPEWRLCGRRRFAGGIGSVEVSIRSLVAEGLAVDAARTLFAHNHPSGDAEPSGDDLAFTRLLATMLAAVGMPLVDHLIVTPRATTSLRARGLL